MSFYPIIDTIGFELEITELEREENYTRILGIRKTRDASVESIGARLYELPFIIKDVAKLPRTLQRSLANSKIILGAELTTEPPIFDREQLHDTIKQLTNQLFLAGESQIGVRDSFHVHVGFAYNLEILKNSIKWALAVENLLFHIGGMGYAFRGFSNNSIFCRPFSEFGPPIVKNKGKYVKLFEVESLLHARTIQEFWHAFGGISTSDVRRYHPSRYFFINPMSLLLHGTLEFRVFNKSLCAEKLIAVIEFCRNLSKLILAESPKRFFKTYQVKSADIFTRIPVEENMEFLRCFADYTGLEEEYLEVLLEILKETPQFILPKTYVLTHLRDFRNANDQVLPRGFKEIQVDKKEVIETVIEDIHFLLGER